MGIGPIPNPQSPIPNPHIITKTTLIIKYQKYLNNFINLILNCINKYYKINSGFNFPKSTKRSFHGFIKTKFFPSLVRV